jgi:superfamily II DNA or RNA helicase
MSILLNATIKSCSCWSDLSPLFAGLPDKQKGDLFEELVKAYLLLDPEYATKLRHVWLHREVPVSVRETLRLPDADKGIDLIAQTKEGEFWAIQCKYRTGTNNSLPWREISTFTGLAFGVCRNISFGLICSTTERITHVLKKQDKIGFCALDVWQGLDDEFFIRLRASLGHKSARLKPLKPRPHQVAAIRDAHAHFVTKKERRGKLIMPCGTGKSLAAYWIARKLGEKRILVAVPSLALIRQTLKVWLRESMANGQAVEWVCVCSDESAGRIGQDDVAVLKQDLGIPCLTDPGDIAKWLGKANDGMTVVFATYQSGEAIAKAARLSKTRFDLGIMDEAHKTVGAKDKLFSHLLYDKNLPIHRRIFMTATERRYQGESDQILSMDDPDVYGDTFHLLSVKRAMEYNPPILSQYRILTISVGRDEVANLIRKNVFVRPDKGRWDQEIETEMLAALVALRKAMTKYPIRHAVSFHGSIHKAEVFKAHNDSYTRAFPSHGSVSTFHVSGQTPTGTRARIIKDFADTKRGIITNARCLTEGVDVPDIDCVMFADPRRSAVDIVQAVGRALRPAAGKKMGYVIVPILHDADAKPDDIFDSEEFREVLTTLRALAANDDRIIEYFRAISQGKRHSRGGIVEFDLDERLAKRIDVTQFARDIELKCWDRLAKLSWRPFKEARIFSRSLNLASFKRWVAYTQGLLPKLKELPADIPAYPHQTYADQGWKGYGDWLGTGTIAPHMRKYRSFTAARDFIRKLKLKSYNEWRMFCMGQMRNLGKLPVDIPASPDRVYIHNGWQGYGDWLGTGTIAPSLKEYRSFRDARAFARKLKLESGSEWLAYCKGKMPNKVKLPADIPTCPNRTYADMGWKGMGDWLGTGRLASRLKKHRSFSKARAFARKLQLKSGKEWRAFCKGKMLHKGRLPADIPACPNQTYADKGWKGMGDWLGTGIVAAHLRKYRSFGNARHFAQNLNLKNESEWRAFCKGKMPKKGKLPDDIPATPSQTYAQKGWKGFGDWLGTGTIAPRLRKYRAFREARAFARNLKLKGQKEWFSFCNGRLKNNVARPSDIPQGPHNTYAHRGWKGYGDWLGTERIASRLKRYRSFPEARIFARKLNLKAESEWRAFCKGQMLYKGRLPADIPACPNQTYADKGWKGMGDWLGTGRVAYRSIKYLEFHKAREFARKLKLKNQGEWREFCRGEMPKKGKLPVDIPSKPDNTYADKGWKGMGDWLGTGTIAPRLRKYRAFRDARAFIRGLKIKNQDEWITFCKGKMPKKGKLPEDIPVKPDRVYRGKGWLGVGDWLGTGRIANQHKRYRSFGKARIFAHKLQLKGIKEWLAYCKGKMPHKGRLPKDIPAFPSGVYADKGWKGFGDWLGTGRKPRAKRL